MISKEYVEQLFKTSTMQRWTDHIRPFDLTALGKHAHMVTIAWVLGRRAETEANELWQIDWDYLIRSSLYELLRVSVLTDIKSPVLDEIRKSDDKWSKVNTAVISEMATCLPGLPQWFKDDMQEYYSDEHSTPERWNAHLILKAASALATVWEFRLIEVANPFLHDLAETKQNVAESVRAFQYMPAVLEIYENRNELGRFSDLCGRLRFQLRWSQTPILPIRPVLDHELLVGYLSYACVADKRVDVYSLEMWKRYHAFFGAVFHDLPEVLTRDVISPVKAFSGGVIGEIIGDIEREWFEKTFRPMLPKRLYHELRFLALDEFNVKNWPPADWPAYLQHLDKSREGSIYPGPLVEACDKFAGFMEAYYSFTFGVTSPNLRAAIYPTAEGLAKREKMNKEIYDFGRLYEHFTKLLLP